MIRFWYKCNFFEPSDFGWASVFMEARGRSKTAGSRLPLRLLER
jgi:hypothetical protein